MSLKLFLLRHGESEANVNQKLNLTIPDHDICLSPRGEEQAKEAGKFLAKYLYHKHEDLKCGLKLRVWSSPYRRTRQTSKAIYDELQLLSGMFELSYREDVMLIEQQYGLFDGYSTSECEEKFPIEYAHYKKSAANQGKFWAQFPNGESKLDVVQRIRCLKGSWIRDYERHGIDTLVIVSHGITIRCAIADFLHLPYGWCDQELNPANASVRLICSKEDKGYIFDGF
jgi:2,3-bisphosphoglycerate-dependent phosphoglycerate mutase